MSAPARADTEVAIDLCRELLLLIEGVRRCALPGGTGPRDDQLKLARCSMSLEVHVTHSYNGNTIEARWMARACWRFPVIRSDAVPRYRRRTFQRACLELESRHLQRFIDRSGLKAPCGRRRCGGSGSRHFARISPLVCHPGHHF